jgi:SOS-response transcriptional repressor LexA
MVGSGIFPDDLLVVDKSLTPTSGDIVLALLTMSLFFVHILKKDRRSI